MEQGINRKELFINAVEGLKLKFPVADIAEKTGYSKGNISEFLNEKNLKEPTRPFLLEFCKSFNLDYDKIFAGKKRAKAAATADMEEIVADPQIPGIYQRIVDELIESSKAQRDASKAMADISRALLEERQMIRETAQAAITLATKTTEVISKKEVQEIKTSLHDVEDDLDKVGLDVEHLQSAVIYGFAKVLNKKPDEIQTLLHSGWVVNGKTSDKKGVTGN